MPHKRYKSGCGPSCLRCWVNNLKHGNKQAKAYLKEHPELDWNVKHDTDVIDMEEESLSPEVPNEIMDEKEKIEKKVREKRNKDISKRRRELLRCLPPEERNSWIESDTKFLE